MKRLGHVLVLVSALSACADSDPGPLRIEATVTYAGAAKGALVVAAFPSIPPMGAPVAFAQEATPAFPTMLTLEMLEPTSTVYVLALLDVAPASPQQPGPEDRTVWSSAVDVGTEGATAVNLTLADP
jgi:hypothetical protein